MNELILNASDEEIKMAIEVVKMATDYQEKLATSLGVIDTDCGAASRAVEGLAHEAWDKARAALETQTLLEGLLEEIKGEQA
jgi:hypothetical protein